MTSPASRIVWLAACAFVALAPHVATAATPAAADTNPRADARPKTCLVLSGGGARGAAHIGVLKVLEELRIPVDCVVGTSMGAIVGAAYASGMSPQRIEETVRDADWNSLLSDQPPRAERSVYAKEVERSRVGGLEVGVRKDGLVLPQGVLVGHQLHFFLQKVVSQARTDRFDELPIPYRAIATDFETGGMVVLDQGDLATAIRASMSVPGAFAPVERDGRILVDGGLVRNLPIDVARQMGAEIVIAVNVGTPLLRREELTSLVSAAAQTLSILTEQNVQASLGTLGPRDVLVAPDLGDVTAGDFQRSTEAIPTGEAAARAVADRLAGLSVDEATYERWRQGQQREVAEPRIDALRVDTSGLQFVRPESVDAVFAGAASDQDVRRAVNQLLGTDDFQRVEARLEENAEGTTLVLRPIEKSWGPNYLRGGLAMDADLEGSSNFTVYLDHRATWLTPSGLEWRNRFSFGQFNSIDSELRQPLDLARRWFVAPRLEFRQLEREFFVEDDPVATYRNRVAGIDLGVGRRLGNVGEAIVGVSVAEVTFDRTRGERAVQEFDGRVASWRGLLVLDRLDSLDFPQTGTLVEIDGRFARRFAGGEDAYDRLSLRASKAFGSGPRSLLLTARYYSALGSDLPLYDAFAAGGFLNLSGYQRDEILASEMTVLRAVYRHRVAGGSSLLPGLFLGASLEGADVRERLNGDSDLKAVGGSVFFSAESVLGTFFVGVGYAEGGRSSIYLNVGRPSQ
jgi:NTE family protein